MHARDAVVKIGHASNERRQGLGLDAAFGAVIAVGQEAEGWIVGIGGDAAAPQIGFGDGAWDGACEREEPGSGFTWCVRRLLPFSCAAGLNPCLGGSFRKARASSKASLKMGSPN